MKQVFRLAGAIIAAAALLVSVASPSEAKNSGRSGDVVKVEMEDRCDPESFNEALGEEICFPSEKGDVTFAEFEDKLNPDDFGHGAWRFSDEDIDLDRGDTLRVKNIGGEGHSFTKVAEFGGGCVDPINIPLGLTPVEECPEAFATVRGPGETFEISGLERGTHFYECIIHPWMRSTVTVD